MARTSALGAKGLAATLALLCSVGDSAADVHGPWASAWTLPAPSSTAERERACANYRARLHTADTLVGRLDPASNAIAAAIAHDVCLRASRVFGEDSEQAMDALFTEAEATSRTTQRALASVYDMLQRVRASREARLGPMHKSLAQVVLLEARYHSLMQDPDGTREKGLQAVAISAAQVPVDSMQLSRIYVNVCTYLARVGDPRAALPFAQAATEIRRRVGASKSAYVSALNNVCACYSDLRWPREAEPVCEEVYRLQRELHPPEAIAVGLVAGNLGAVRAQLGDLESALALYDLSLRSQVRTYGANYAGVGETLVNVASAHVRQARFDEAERVYREAVAVFDAAVEPAHANALAALEGLGHAQWAQGRFAAADSSFTEVLRRVPPDLSGPAPIAVPKALVGHARILADRGDHVAARVALQQADSLLVVTLGAEHISRLHSLNARAEHESATGNRGTALEAIRDACRIEREHERYTLRALPEEDILRYRESPSSSVSAALRSVVSAPAESAWIAAVWDEVAASRGLGRKELRTRFALRVPPGDSAGKVLEERYRMAAWRIDRLLSGSRGRTSPDTLERAIAATELAGRELARHLAGQSSVLEAPRPRARDARSALPRDAALVAFHRVEPLEASREPAHYVAFVQPPRGGSPRVVRLGGAKDLEAALPAWRAAVERAGTTPAEAKRAERLGKKLWTDVWRPVANAIGPMDRAFVVADGELQTIAPGAWNAPDDARDWPVLSMLEHESDLVVGPRRASSVGETLLVVGGVDYGGTTRARPQVVRSSHGDSVSTGFEPLPASIAEARAVAQVWRERGGSVRELSGREATAHAFRNGATRAQALHVASHTWSLDSRTDLSLDPGPLRRVGLAFAGANQPDPSVVGVLTGAEISRMDLSGVRLVIISACRSGLGRPITGEGLLGLRSAFATAGARTVVASLWNVSDESTAYWMREFYVALATRRGDAPLAARDASFATRTWSRSKPGAKSPYAWGAFTVSGPP